MASNIVPDNIDGTYPIAGIDNDSQGFRTNFTNTSTNFTAASDEIEDLQAKAILKAPLSGEPSVDNDMGGEQIISATLLDQREQIFDHEVISGSFIVSHVAGSYQTVETGGSITIVLADFPASGLQLGRVRLEINVTDTSHTVTLPASVVHGIEFIQGAGTTIFLGQDETDYDGAGSNGTFFGGDGVGFEYVALDEITLTTGTVVRVDAVDGSGVVTAFTIIAAGTVAATAGITYQQSSTTSSAGIGFTLTPESNNISAAGEITFDEAAYYTFEFTTYDNAEVTIQDLTRSGAGGGSGGSLGSLTDVTLSSPAPDEVLTFNGVQWANSASGAFSAYEIAVQNGFVGTEAAWLTSLEGADGLDGAQGIQGIQGVPGIQGDPGPQGPAGPIGAVGPQGAAAPLLATVPADELGVSGDRNGNIACDNSYLYVCYLNYDPTYVQPFQDETDYPGGGSPDGDFVGGTGYTIGEIITLESLATVQVDNEAAGVVTEFTILSENDTENGVLVAEGIADDQIYTSLSTAVGGQDETDFDGAGSNGTFSGGTGYTASDTISLPDGTVITVDTEVAGVITEFTVTTPGTGPIEAGAAQAQVSSSGPGLSFSLTFGTNNLNSGFGFNLTPESNNVVGGGGVNPIWGRSLFDRSAF